MKRKRKTKTTLSKSAILVISIVMLNFVGIGYAAWTDSLNIQATLTTGKIQPVFYGGTYISINEKDKATIKDGFVMEENDEKIMTITVKNKGTIPVKAEEVQIDRHGLMIEIPQHEIEPDKSTDVDVKIIANKPGEYNFNTNPIKISYKQFNDK